jgi:Ca2+-binding EF-hand superfamily protein
MQMEKTMKNRTKLAVTFIALAGLTGTAMAQDRGDRGMRGDRQDRFERLDADTSGDITFEEFKAMFDGRMRLSQADADGDGKLTVAEVADHIQHIRAERMAERLIQRLDADGDGTLSLAEIESRQQKRFALMDRNDDGVLSADEMRHRGKRFGR